jgi:hypothetical protein
MERLKGVGEVFFFLVGERVKERRDNEEVRVRTINVVEDSVSVGFIVCINSLLGFISRDPHCVLVCHRLRKKKRLSGFCRVVAVLFFFFFFY